MLVGIGMSALNMLLLVVLVGLAGLNPLVANLCRTACTTQLQFGLHRRFTWRNQNQPLGRQWARFHALKVVTLVLNQLGFMALIALGLHYLVAYSACALLVGSIKGRVCHLFIFTTDPPIAE